MIQKGPHPIVIALTAAQETQVSENVFLAIGVAKPVCGEICLKPTDIGPEYHNIVGFTHVHPVFRSGISRNYPHDHSICSACRIQCCAATIGGGCLGGRCSTNPSTSNLSLFDPRTRVRCRLILASFSSRFEGPKYHRKRPSAFRRELTRSGQYRFGRFTGSNLMVKRVVGATEHPILGQMCGRGTRHRWLIPPRPRI